MRHSLATTFVLLLLCPGVLARDIHNWGNVTKLKRGTPVLLVLRSGRDVTGQIESLTDSTVQLGVPDSDNYQAGWIQTIERTAIRKVVRMRRPLYYPDTQHWIVAGALVGGSAGVASGAISDIRHGNQARWLIGGFVGSFAGASLGGAAAIVVVLAQIPGALLGRNKLIFEADDPTNHTNSPGSHRAVLLSH